MFDHILAALDAEFAGLAAKNYVRLISQYHRLEASPGFRAAAAFVADQLDAWGLHTCTLSYPADGRTLFWSHLAPVEWEATEGELWLTSPEEERRKLANYRVCKFDLIHGSVSTPLEGVEAKVVVLEDGEEVVEYSGLDLTGKVVLTRGNVERVRELAVERCGALGILYDGMRDVSLFRERTDLPDARQWTSFSWFSPAQRPCWGFVLSPRQGDWLRSLVKQSMGVDGHCSSPVRVKSNISSRFVPDGTIEVVSAFIAGRTEEEVVVVAHLCHPQYSANDNASGSAVVMEIARALHALVESGILAQPRRAIRFLLVPEYSGTFAYLADHESEIANMVAAINVDMVGENQDLCGSVFLVELPSLALPSFAESLAVRVQEAVARQAMTHRSQEGCRLLRYAVRPFFGGSDHLVLTDPSVGVPCVMITELPDKFYHTSYDTPDKVDENSLRWAGLLAGTYAYFLANSGVEEASWLGEEMVAQFKARVLQLTEETLSWAMAETSPPSCSSDKEECLVRHNAALEKGMRFAIDRQTVALATLRRLAGTELAQHISGWQREIVSFGNTECARTRQSLRKHAATLGIGELCEPPPQPLSKWERTAATIVPVRCYRGPVRPRSLWSKLSPAARDALWLAEQPHRTAARSILWSKLALYWADGRRSLLDIVDKVEQECGRPDVEFLVRYFGLLQEAGLVKLRTTDA